MESFAVWKSRPVFISSAFRDMNAERDYLRDWVFHKLEERLKERFHHLEPIDLRWGVETKSVDNRGRLSIRKNHHDKRGRLSYHLMMNFTLF